MSRAFPTKGSGTGPGILEELKTGGGEAVVGMFTGAEDFVVKGDRAGDRDGDRD